MTDYENVRIYKANNNENISSKDKKISFTQNNEINKNKEINEKKDINEKNENLDYSIGLSMCTTKIISKEVPNNRQTHKSNRSRISAKNKTTGYLKNKLIYIGDIEQAKIHSNANRPLKKVGEFDSKTQFCKCCGLPCEKEGIMEKYNFKDSTEEFIKHGQVISLYFSFYIYSIFILAYAFFAISLPTIVITHQRANELDKICNELPNKKDFDECSIYLINNEKGTSYSSILDFSGLNIKNYKIIHSKLTESSNKNADKIIVNYSVLNFIGLITILFFNFGYILLLYNQTYLPDINIITPKKYSIIITEMDGFYSYLKNRFLSDNNTNNDAQVDITQKKSKKNSIAETEKKYSEREKLEEKEDINEISDVEKFKNLFKERLAEIFLDNHEKFNIKQVNVCFKINEYIKKEGELEKCNEYIEKVESLPYQIQKNEGLKDEDKNYFYSPLSEFNIHWFEKKNL